MEQQTIFIKGMVCQRCLMTVEAELREIGYTPVKLSLGEVSFTTNTAHDYTSLEERLSLLGFSLLKDKKAQMAKEIKELVKEIYSGDFDFRDRFRFSGLASKHFQRDYDVISDAFTVVEKKTIEQYIIEYRIDRVKEFLVYSNLNLSDIAFRLNFNSVAHLSAQFRQYTGLTASFFRKIKKQKAGVIFSSN
jgi:AraC-like DNA-binding protein